MYFLKNKNIIVTGSASGLGYAVSKSLIDEEKSNVICLDKNKIKNFNFKNSHTVDFTNNLKLKNTIHSIIKKYKIIHGVVNCAAVTIPENRFPKKDFKKWKKTFSVNIDSIFMICSILCENAIKNNQKLNIINFTSIGAHQGFPKNSAYCASKGAVTQLTKSFSLDYGKFGIRANCIVPGYFKTPMNKKSWTSLNERKKRSSKTILGRWGLPKEICGPVKFLLSEESSYITGSDIIVDGGWLSKGF